MNNFSIAIVGRTGVGKSSCIASLVGDFKIRSTMLGENFLGRTKTNVKYLLYKGKRTTNISVDVNIEYIKGLIEYKQNEIGEESIDYSGLCDNISEVFKGIEIPEYKTDDFIISICKNIKKYIDNKITKDNYVEMFNSNLNYVNFINNIVIETEMSDIAKNILMVEVLECIDTRGVFDNDNNIKRIIPKSTATILAINGNGESKETIEMMCDRIKDVFRKPISLMIRDNGYDLDQEYTVKEEVLRYKREKNEYKEYGETLKNIMQLKGYLPKENLVKANDVYYNLLCNNKVNVIPTVGKKRSKEFKEFDWEVYTTIVCNSINEIISTYVEIQEASKNIINKWNENKDVKVAIYNIIREISKKASIDICSGKIRGVHQQPRSSTIIKNAEAKYNYDDATVRYNNLATKEWIEEYIKHYVTVSAAEVLGELNDIFVNELDSIKLNNISNIELLLLIRAIYQHNCNLQQTGGYRWFNSFVSDIRIGDESYKIGEEKLDEIYKKYKKGSFNYTSLRDQDYRYAKSILLCLIYNSACDEVARFAHDDESLSKVINNDSTELYS